MWLSLLAVGSVPAFDFSDADSRNFWIGVLSLCVGGLAVSFHLTSFALDHPSVSTWALANGIFASANLQRSPGLVNTDPNRTPGNKVVPLEETGTDAPECKWEVTWFGSVIKQLSTSVIGHTVKLSSVVHGKVRDIRHRPWFHTHILCTWLCFLVDIFASFTMLCEMILVCCLLASRSYERIIP